MDVTLPNGRVIKGVPDGTPKDVIKQKAIAAGLAMESDFPQMQSKPDVAEQQPTQAQQPETSIGEDILGGLENVASIGSGIIAEPLAGLAGIVQSANPFADEGAGARAVEATREALTYDPRTQAGQQQQQAIGEALAPVGEALETAETTLGEGTLDMTGSPFLATVAHTLPTAALEVLGFKGTKGLKAKPKAPKVREIQKAVVESAPEAAALKDASKAIYKEIDDAGATVKANRVDSLVNRIEANTRKKGLDARVTAKAAGALDSMKEMKGSPQTLSELDVQRSIAQQVAKSPDPSEAMLGNIMIDEIDSFMDSIGSKDIEKGQAGTAQKYKAARKLYGRAKRSEMITEAIEKGADAASGAENGIRNQFRHILNNKKKSKYFSKDELQAMRDVVQGDFKTNTAKLLGRFGFSEGGATNIIGSLAGGAGGAAAFGAPGAVAVPLIGQASREIAQKLTRNKAKFADAITRAGKDANEIAKAYLSIVPKAKRSAKDLADLLTDPSINLDELKMLSNETLKEAVEISRGQRALAGAALASSAQQSNQEDQSTQ